MAESDLPDSKLNFEIFGSGTFEGNLFNRGPNSGSFIPMRAKITHISLKNPWLTGWRPPWMSKLNKNFSLLSKGNQACSSTFSKERKLIFSLSSSSLSLNSSVEETFSFTSPPILSNALPS
eukprot:Pompholyxophrys_punicea_v1_NODE_152_length_3178_cov_3.531540.p4 type:complete len:121 gc:universal NODE_152_length_3178_cov_3.531540:769-407(-)